MTPDVFVEVIRYSETREYIRRIYELFNIYRLLYASHPWIGNKKSPAFWRPCRTISRGFFNYGVAVAADWATLPVIKNQEVIEAICRWDHKAAPSDTSDFFIHSIRVNRVEQWQCRQSAANRTWKFL